MFTNFKFYSNRDTSRAVYSSSLSVLDAEREFFATKAKFGNSSSYNEQKASYNYEANELKELNAWRKSLLDPTDDEKQSA
jgi:hypothetical protein